MSKNGYSYFFSRKPTKQKEHLIFGFILLLFSLLIISNMVTNSFLLINYAKLIFISRHLSLIIVPLMYMYLNIILTGKEYQLKHYLKHFMLFIITTPILLIVLFSIKKFNIYNSNLRFVSGFLILFQNSYYLRYSYLLIKNEKKNKKLREKIKWSKVLLFGFLFIWMIQFCSFVLIDIYRNFFICPYTISMFFLTAFVMIYIIVFLLIETKKIISHKSKYEYSTLSEKEIDSIFEKMQMYFKKHKPFTDNEFSISKLSDDLNIPIKQISQAINSTTDSNFNDFVNNYRLEESKKFLLETSKKELSISEIYFLVGFNSKSAFYMLFKKKYGQTPSELRKQNISKIENI